MSYSMSDYGSAFRNPLDWEAWLRLLHLKEAEFAFYRARNRSRFRRLAAIFGLPRSAAYRAAAQADSRSVLPISLLRHAIGSNGRLRRLPALRKAHLDYWRLLWLDESAESVPVAVADIGDELVLADAGRSLIALELARWRGAAEVAVIIVETIPKADQAVIYCDRGRGPAADSAESTCDACDACGTDRGEAKAGRSRSAHPSSMAGGSRRGRSAWQRSVKNNRYGD